MKKFKIYSLFYLMLFLVLSSCQEDEIENALEITGLSPVEAHFGDTITIQGQGFKEVQTTVVRFEGNVLGQITEITPIQLSVVVPRGAQEGNIQVRTGKYVSAYSSEIFGIIPSPPFISSISPSQGPPGFAFTITGEYLADNYLFVSDSLKHKENVAVYFDDTILEIDSIHANRIWLKVPENMENGEVEVKVVKDGMTSNIETFKVGNPPIQDDFNRPVTEWATNETSPNPIRSDWMIVNGEWKIEGPGDNETNSGYNYIYGRRLIPGDILMANTSGMTMNGAGKGFTLSADVYIPELTDYILGGLAFNVQDEQNYYAFRLGGAGLIQLLRVVDGTPSAIFSLSAFADQLQGQNTYRMEVVSDEPYVFTLRILSAGNLVAEGTFTDDRSLFQDGAAALYTSSQAYFDNFLLISREN